MTAPNVNTLWGRVVADELAKAGVEAAVLAPGSRSTPLTVAFATHGEIETFSLLDERSAAFFALGRAKRTATPVPLVCTSGTAVANFHPAVVEADRARVPMLILSADRPPELHDSGANQTIDQRRIYGDAVRAARTLPEPEAADRKLRSLRTALDRAVAASTGVDPGPVHLDVPFRKPLEPTVETDDPPETFAAAHPLAVDGRDGPFVDVTPGRPDVSDADADRIAATVSAAEAGLIVCGPANAPTPSRDAVSALARASGFPVFADPLSGVRFGPHVDQLIVCGGYDGYVGGLDATPDVVVRFGASPTSKHLRKYLRDADANQFVVDPTGGWREAEFTATDLVVADPTRFALEVADRADRSPGPFESRIDAVENGYWEHVEGNVPIEGRVLGDVTSMAPDPSTLFVSNSMPVRDLDRFGEPRTADLSVAGNRGASGIDGITSTALGVGSAADDPLVIVLGDLAYYHDMNGLLAVSRCGVDATIVLINNDGGGIFHLLPIEAHESFEEWFKTPHGLDFEPTAELYDLAFARTDDRDSFRRLYRDAVGSDGTHVIEFRTDANESHDVRRALETEIHNALADGSL